MVYVIDRGQVLTQGTPTELKARHGRTVLRVEPVSDAARTRIRQAFPDSVDAAEGRLAIPLVSGSALGATLKRIGDDLGSVEIDQPSLESVFLSLTGRDLREARTAPAKPKKGARRG